MWFFIDQLVCIPADGKPTKKMLRKKGKWRVNNEEIRVGWEQLSRSYHSQMQNFRNEIGKQMLVDDNWLPLDVILGERNAEGEQESLQIKKQINSGHHRLLMHVGKTLTKINHWIRSIDLTVEDYGDRRKPTPPTLLLESKKHFSDILHGITNGFRLGWEAKRLAPHSPPVYASSREVDPSDPTAVVQIELRHKVRRPTETD